MSAKSHGGNWAVVMAGGRGTRFWPESRNRDPKPFLKFLGDRSLLEETVRRLSPLIAPSRILVVLQKNLVGRAHRLLKNIPRGNILGESVGRNTAPCCVWAAAEIERRDPSAKIVFLPSDQWIHPKSLYLKTLKAAFDLVDEKPVLLGMRVTSPHTGYGYLEVGKPAKRTRGISTFTVRRFFEKPALAQAKRFQKSGRFLWNGGTFIWRLDAFNRAIRKHWGRVSFFMKNKRTGKMRTVPYFYQNVPSISLDCAVMEKLPNVHCLQVPFQWSDLGSWEGVAGFWKKDASGNRAGTGSLIAVKARRNLVKPGRRLVALLGVSDLLVVDSEDVLLIASRSSGEKIREVVRELERRKAWKYL